MNARDRLVELALAWEAGDPWEPIVEATPDFNAGKWFELVDAVRQYDGLINHHYAYPPENVVGDDDAKAGGWEYARDIAEQQVEDALDELLRTDRKVA